MRWRYPSVCPFVCSFVCLSVAWIRVLPLARLLATALLGQSNQVCPDVSHPWESSPSVKFMLVSGAYATMRYDIDYLTYSKKLTCSQLSPPHGTNRKITEQELSYRKQIARQMRTQYVEGIYRPKYYTMTLKSRLRVTQGHWKRNHWIDHTRLTVSRVIWRWILSLP